MDNIDSPLAYYIHKQTTLDSWFDLENLLHIYAADGLGIFLHTSRTHAIPLTEAVKEDRLFFNKLKGVLESFIKSQCEIL